MLVYALSCPGEGDNVLGQQMVGTSDWPDFEGDASFTVPPKAMPELYTLMADQVRCVCGVSLFIGGEE